MFAVTAVIMMHEQMHQWAGEQQQVRQVLQRAFQMRLVLHDKEVTGDQEETDQDADEYETRVAVYRRLVIVVHKNFL